MWNFGQKQMSGNATHQEFEMLSSYGRKRAIYAYVTFIVRFQTTGFDMLFRVFFINPSECLFGLVRLPKF